MTIDALSTGTGISGIAIIRVSGPDTKEVIKKLTNISTTKQKMFNFTKHIKTN